MRIPYAVFFLSWLSNFVMADRAVGSALDDLKNLVRQGSPVISDGNTLSVRASYTVDSLSVRDNKTWLHEECSDVEWYQEEGGQQRFLLQCNKQKVPRRGSTSSYGIINQTVFFSGDSVRRVVESIGRSGRPLVGATCNLESFNDHTFDDFLAMLSGRAFSLSYLLGENSKIMEDYLPALKSYDVELDGEDTVVELKSEKSGAIGKLTQNLFVRIGMNPHPYLKELINKSIFENQDGVETNIKSYSVHETETLGQYVYPKNATIVTSCDGKVVATWKIEFRDWSVSGHFPATPVLPPRTTVIDTRTGERFKTGDSPAELVERVSSLLD